MIEVPARPFFELALTQLCAECLKEYVKKEPEYGDTWLSYTVDDLKRAVKIEATKLTATEDLDLLVHRIIDLAAYTTFLFAQTNRDLALSKQKTGAN